MFAALLEHYRSVARDLPWRGTSDPYVILVSEFMLQQTRVEAARPYYLRFMARFPTFEALAEAQVQEVEAAWSGLGYYQRARNLHRAVRQVKAQGRWPTGRREWAGLPGVGAYTSAALASLVDGHRAVALDGNALRVFTRYFGRDQADGPALRRELEALVLPHIPPDSAGDFTQATIELGATLCRPRRPLCGECPLASACRAHLEGLTEQLPRPKARRAPELQSGVLLRLWMEGRVLLDCNPGREVLPGRWILPWFPDRDQALDWLAQRFGPVRLEPVGACRHSITHRSFALDVLEGRPEAALVAEPDPRYRWVDPARLGELPCSSLTRKALRPGELQRPSKRSSMRALS